VSLIPKLLLLSKPPGNIHLHGEHWSCEKPILAPAHSWTLLLVAWGLQRMSSSWHWWSRVSPAAALSDPRASAASSELGTGPAPGDSFLAHCFQSLPLPSMAGAALHVLLFH